MGVQRRFVVGIIVQRQVYLFQVSRLRMFYKDRPSTLQRQSSEILPTRTCGNSGGHGRRRDGGKRGACAARCLRRGPELVFL